MCGRALGDELDRLPGLLLGFRQDAEVPKSLGVLPPEVPVLGVELDGAPELLEGLLNSPSAAKSRAWRNFSIASRRADSAWTERLERTGGRS
ncbi:MAG: hypothetical protein IPF66_02000 [Holophagales bacterium]|nr:hypothetical protein [Holophagales bacterium]